MQLISIAYDQNESKVKQYIKDNKLKWQHIFQSYDEGKHSLVKQLKVSTYPAFILIDPNGTILYRGDGKEALSKINDLLQNSN